MYYSYHIQEKNKLISASQDFCYKFQQAYPNTLRIIWNESNMG